MLPKLRASRCARVRNLSHLSRPWSSHFTSQDCCQFCLVSDRMNGPNFYSSHRTWQALSHGSTASTSSRKTHHFFQFSQSVPSRKTHTRINWACLLFMTSQPWRSHGTTHGTATPRSTTAQFATFRTHTWVGTQDTPGFCA